jgi:serine/threonine protein kinase
VQLHRKIETKNNFYMIQDYCNGLNLATLLKIRGCLTQTEVGLVLKSIVMGLADLWKVNIIHRDIKLPNIMLHFPDNAELDQMPNRDKQRFLAVVDLTRVRFQAKICDFGLSTVYT